MLYIIYTRVLTLFYLKNKFKVHVRIEAVSKIIINESTKHCIFCDHSFIIILL